MVASTMLAMSTQTDLAFAALSSITSNSSPQSITTGSWVVFAGATPSSSASAAGYSVTPMTQGSCVPSGGSQLSKTISTTFSNGNSSYRKVALNDVTGITKGMVVTESSSNNIVNSGTNRVTNINTETLEITLTTGSQNNGSVHNSGSGTLYFDVAAMITSSTWATVGGIPARQATLDMTTGLANNMLVSDPINLPGIVNNGTNTVLSFSSNSKTVTLNIGGNSSPKDAILVFRTNGTCTPPPATYNEMFSVNNTGTIDVAKVAFTLSSASITLQKCSVPWTETAGVGSCIGGSATSVTANGISQTLSVTAGGTVRLRAVSSAANTSATITVIVSTADLPTPAVNVNQ